MICRLPNEILGHILSFLPIKDVVRTSILSKSWRELRTSLANFNFDDHIRWQLSVERETTFGDFMDRFCYLHNSLENFIVKFHLRVHGSYPSSCISNGFLLQLRTILRSLYYTRLIMFCCLREFLVVRNQWCNHRFVKFKNYFSLKLIFFTMFRIILMC